MAHYDAEKHPVVKAASVSSGHDTLKNEREGDAAYAREELVDPAREETLHRGLSARQISMIAVRALYAVVDSRELTRPVC